MKLFYCFFVLLMIAAVVANDGEEEESIEESDEKINLCGDFWVGEFHDTKEQCQQNCTETGYHCDQLIDSWGCTEIC